MNGGQQERRMRVCADLEALLADDPEAVGEVIGSLVGGMRDAVRIAERRSSIKDMAMLAALSLMDGKRISGELRDQLGVVIARGLDGRSVIEDSMRQKFSAPG